MLAFLLKILKQLPVALRIKSNILNRALAVTFNDFSLALQFWPLSADPDPDLSHGHCAIPHLAPATLILLFPMVSLYSLPPSGKSSLKLGGEKVSLFYAFFFFFIPAASSFHRYNLYLSVWLFNARLPRSMKLCTLHCVRKLCFLHL